MSESAASLLLFAFLLCSCNTSAMSPCQCKLAGGCGMHMLPPDGKPYADGTYPDDYDAWGFYTGQLDVPKECRRDE